MEREVARIGTLTDEQREWHSLRTGMCDVTQLPLPAFVVLEIDAGVVTLYRFARDGEFCGNTCHASIADAKAQATLEYAQALGEWRSVPEGVASNAAGSL